MQESSGLSICYIPQALVLEVEKEGRKKSVVVARDCEMSIVH